MFCVFFVLVFRFYGDHFHYCTVDYLVIFETLIAQCSCHGLNSDVRTKAFQAVDQFLQIAKQHYEKVYSEFVFGCYSDAYHGPQISKRVMYISFIEEIRCAG